MTDAMKAITELTMEVNNSIEDFIVEAVTEEIAGDDIIYHKDIVVNAQKIAEALGKQIPKKPIEIEDGWVYWYCPTCRCKVGELMKFKEHHCICGQAILWEGVE